MSPMHSPIDQRCVQTDMTFPSLSGYTLVGDAVPILSQEQGKTNRKKARASRESHTEYTLYESWSETLQKTQHQATVGFPDK